MKKLIPAALLALASTLAFAQAPGARSMTDGEVRKVDKAASKVTVKHGPITSLDMPAMTMVFQVRDATLLDKLATGDKIRFAVEQQQGAYVITAVEKAAN